MAIFPGTEHLMAILSISAIVLTLVGFAILARRVLGKRTALRFLTERGVDPHLLGYHLLGAGALLALFPWVFQERSWVELSAAGHLTVAAAALWAGIALSLSAVALLRPPGWASSAAGLPGPETPVHRWPALYRGFLAAGFAVMFALAALAL
jgi:hypothetical protein